MSKEVCPEQNRNNDTLREMQDNWIPKEIFAMIIVRFKDIKYQIQAQSTSNKVTVQEKWSQYMY